MKRFILWIFLPAVIMVGVFYVLTAIPSGITCGYTQIIEYKVEVKGHEATIATTTGPSGTAELYIFGWKFYGRSSLIEELDLTEAAIRKVIGKVPIINRFGTEKTMFSEPRPVFCPAGGMLVRSKVLLKPDAGTTIGFAGDDILLTVDTGGGTAQAAMTIDQFIDLLTGKEGNNPAPVSWNSGESPCRPRALFDSQNRESAKRLMADASIVGWYVVNPAGYVWTSPDGSVHGKVCPGSE